MAAILLGFIFLVSCGGGSGGSGGTDAGIRNVSKTGATCLRTMRSFGAVGDSYADDTGAVRAAFDSLCNLEGEGLSYAVGGSMELKGNVTLSNARFIQRASAPDIRTLMKIGGTIVLRQVRVDRGTDERNGEAGNSAGVFLSGVSDSLLEDVEVTGHGYGAGIWVNGSSRVTLMRPYVHDMRWSSPTPPCYEQLLGIWINASEDVSIISGKVMNLLGETGDNVYRSFQTDGITAGGTTRLVVQGTAVENTGEGIDLTGSSPNRQFEIMHSSAIDSDSFGFKVANFGRDGVIRDSVAIRAGYAGFVFSGPSEPNGTEMTSDVTVLRSKALNTGYNGRWAQNTVAGFLVMRGTYNEGYPRQIRVLDSQAIDDQAQHTMKFGFFSQNPTNGLYNVDSSGHTVDGANGFVAAAYGFDFIQQQAQAILGCVVKTRYRNWYFDQSYLQGWTTTRLIADLEDAKRRGLQTELCE